ncbi:hypothetical protein LY76DRAFT_597971 [Colletotrichum caudatum]|nr:hypothetical protein LY76DRAFT_597971 [Colletotrichum caudatum]
MTDGAVGGQSLFERFERESTTPVQSGMGYSSRISAADMMSPMARESRSLLMMARRPRDSARRPVPMKSRQAAPGGRAAPGPGKVPGIWACDVRGERWR